MNWKKWPAWLKGGTLGLIIFFLIFTINFITNLPDCFNYSDACLETFEFTINEFNGFSNILFIILLFILLISFAWWSIEKIVRKNWSYWMRGGIIGLLLALVSWLFGLSIILGSILGHYYELWQYGQKTGEYVCYTCSEQLGWSIIGLWVLIISSPIYFGIFFIFGAIIGWIVDRIINKKEVLSKKDYLKIGLKIGFWIGLIFSILVGIYSFIYERHVWIYGNGIAGIVWVLGTFILGVTLGALIGWIVGKVKSKKRKIIK